MKLLTIDSGKGHFLGVEGEEQPIDQLTKEDLLRLVDLTLAESYVEFDAYDEASLQNQAHQIIYKNVYTKLMRLQERRSEFIDESERLFLVEYENYRSRPNSAGPTVQ